MCTALPEPSATSTGPSDRERFGDLLAVQHRELPLVPQTLWTWMREVAVKVAGPPHRMA
jgi:hypothetical protein